MEKTKEISIECSAARINPSRYHKVSVVVEDPDVDDILDSINEDDLIDWVKRNKHPEDLFSETELAKYAESEGYVKPD
jgi:hypothetical protein